jgi:putative SOS response-associated peptidase YedK
MCSRYANTISYTQYAEVFGALGLPLVSPPRDAAPNLEPLSNIAPTVVAPLIRPVTGGVELCRLRWGLIPWFHAKSIKEWNRLTTNARWETLTTTRTFKEAAARRRCLIPVSEFYEWTGEKGKKTKWGFARSDGDWFCFAGVWDRTQTSDGVIESFALITTAAGPDVAAYHNRQPVILERPEYTSWLSAGVLRDAALYEQPTGLLTVSRLTPPRAQPGAGLRST